MENKTWFRENYKQYAPKKLVLGHAKRVGPAFPKWANVDYMTLFYQMAQEESKDGKEYVVDHIVPLKHPMVCGLHNEHNLQVVPKTYNRFKCNLFWADMPEYSIEDYRSLYVSHELFL